MFERLKQWWRARERRPHPLPTRPPLPHVLARVQYPPVYHVPSQAASSETASAKVFRQLEQFSEARTIAAIPPATAGAIKAMLKQRGTWHLSLPIVDVEHPEVAYQEVYAFYDERKRTIEVGVYSPSREVRRLLDAARAERATFDKELSQRPIDVTDQLLLPAEVEHARR